MNSAGIMNSARTMKTYVDTNVLVGSVTHANIRAQLYALAEIAESSNTPLVTSELTVVELSRTLIREGRSGITPELNLFAGCELVAPKPLVLRLASELPVRHLKTLDSIHLASALISGCKAVVTQDKQFARACHEVGLRTL